MPTAPNNSHSAKRTSPTIVSRSGVMTTSISGELFGILHGQARANRSELDVRILGGDAGREAGQ